MNLRSWMLLASLALPGSGCERKPEPAPAKETRPDSGLQPTSEPPAPLDRIAASGRVIAIGDVHGDLAAARKALRLAAVIDEEDDWIGEKTIVVQTGDQLDRGDDEPEVMALFDALADEAKQKGGAVISLNGNHEVMNVQGDFRYVTDDAFRDFASYAAGAADPSKGRSRAFLPGGPVALKLADRPITAIVGDTLFVHGAVLPAHVSYGLRRINDQARAWMRGEILRIPPELAGDDTLIWSRAYGDEIVNPRACDALGQVLGALKVKRLVVGHTVQKNGISAGCEERVWRIDVGMAKHYGGKPAVLEIQGDRVRAITGSDG